MRDKWESCPRCESKNVKKRGVLFSLLVGISLVGVSLWLLIIPPIGIVGILIGLVVLISAPFTKDNLVCESCNKTWKYPFEDGVSR